MRQVMLPASLEELWALRKEHPDALVMAGGTDLLVRMRATKKDLRPVLVLERIEELRHIELNGSEIIVGAMTSHQQLMDSSIITRHIPALGQAAAMVGSPAIRHMGTMGGNICTASPAGDTLPPLYALQAQVALAGPEGGRMAAIEEFIRGPGQVDLKPGEILKQVIIPLPGKASVSSYFKVGQRQALAISICSMAVFMQINQGRYIEEARIAWGSVGPTVMRFPEADARLQGSQLSASVLREYGEAASRLVAPLSDIRASAGYRRMLVANLPLRLLA
jgi:CO/xanthine dehydrogenase FAD-binding subunit